MEALDTTLYEEGTQVPLNPHTTSSQVSHKDTTVEKALEETVNFTPQGLTPEQQTQARENINALSSEDGAVGNDNIADGAVTNDKICPEAITIDKLELDLEAMVSDNVKYIKQNLTIEQKAQARKNIDVDYLTEDEVTNLWDTTK